MNLNDFIRVIPDFPKKGILYKDITPLLLETKAVDYCLQEFINRLDGKEIDKVAAIESRGFFFGMLLAKELNAGFVPIRKKGKLPYNTLQESYELEYSTDNLEIHQDAINPGENVLLHDDVLATGGTANAACKLIERLGGEIVQCNFLIELTFLEGRKKLNHLEVVSLIGD
ncbi:adenine phosphoribosyltransferase [Mesonia sp. K7]|uniref:adenine phosphoribosyltransferase n=1 Tax=Mesonia sp. K7 TaxID=2218606 RepID=UPI000DA7EC61|nr:adenine phosphoribosyltransferase [Mesonia sp. K7]PZD79711.1 adenine phosphoribosyltransferase [Mesonia sp. K7]